MSLDPRAWRPSPPLPPARGAAIAALCVGAALISLMAVLAMAWLSADMRARPAIRARLSGGATIAVTAPRTAADLESLDAAAWRAREVLATIPGVASARVLASAPQDKAMAAAMGMRAAPSRLIAIGLAPRAAPARPPTMDVLIGALSREGLTAAADDHNPVSGPVERAMTLDAAGLALASAGLIGLLAALTATMIGERARRIAPRITLLSGLGMTHGALLTRLTRPVALSASLAAIAGGAVALILMALAAPRLPGLALLIPAPDDVDLLAAAAWPALAVLVVVFVAAVIGLTRMKRLAP
jgi:hypothetical protein